MPSTLLAHVPDGLQSLKCLFELTAHEPGRREIHPGSFRNHNRLLHAEYGRDKGADIPTRTDYVEALKPLLDRFGNEPNLSIILFTLDESAYARELAPLAGHYPCLRLGPAWWFYDSPEGMRRFRELTTETAGCVTCGSGVLVIRARPSDTLRTGAMKSCGAMPPAD